MLFFQMILEAAMIASACSMDCLATGFAYGTNKIKIPFLSALLINIICSTVLGLSLFLGAVIGYLIPPAVTTAICVTILAFIGVSKIFGSYIKSIIKRKKGLNKEIKFSLFSLNFLLKVYAEPEEADIDNSKVLSFGEASALALAMSLDGLAIGLGAGLTSPDTISYIIIIVFSLLTDFVFLLLGRFLGNKLANKISLNLSWLSGVILIILALVKIFY